MELKYYDFLYGGKNLRATKSTDLLEGPQNTTCLCSPPFCRS